MFVGVRAAAVGSGPRQRGVFADALAARGGELVDLLAGGRPCPLFVSGAQSAANDPLLRGLTHVLVEDRSLTQPALLRELRGSSTHSALVVHSSWLSDSLRLGLRLEEAAYLLRLRSPSKRKLDADADCRGQADGVEPAPWCSLGNSVRYRLNGDGDGPSEEPVRLLCLDLDGTVVRTRSGRVFPRDEFDWVTHLPPLTATPNSPPRTSSRPASPPSSESTASRATISPSSRTRAASGGQRTRQSGSGSCGSSSGRSSG